MRRTERRLAAFRFRACVIGVVSLAGCATTRPKPLPPIVTAVGPCERVGPDIVVSEDTQFYSRAAGRVRLTAAVNSVTAFQLILTAPSTALTGIELSTESFSCESNSSAGKSQTGTVESDSLSSPSSTLTSRLFRLFPITIDRYPGWYLRGIGPKQRRQFFDALAPIDAPQQGQPFTLTVGGKLAIWVEIKIPNQARPGTFHSAVTIHDGNGTSTHVPIDLAVKDVYLSPDQELPALARVQLGPLIASHSRLDPANIRAALADADTRRVLHDTFRLLHDHGLSPYTDEIHPLLAQDLDGSVRLDWSDYDAFCGPLIDGQAYNDQRPAYGWPLPVDLRQPDPIQYDGLKSPAYAAVLTRYLAAVREHFRERGWLNRAWLWFDVAAGPNPTSDELELFQRIASLVHAAPPTTTAPFDRIPLVSTLIPQSMTPFGWLDYRPHDVSSDVDIWATPARYQHRATMDRQQAAGKRVWLPAGRPPFDACLAVEAPGASARSLAWQAVLCRSDALVIPEATNWPTNVLDLAIRDRAQRSDAWLVYPGGGFGLKQPVPSLRLKQLQLGLQDAQMLRLLAEHGHSETARLLAGSLIKACGTDACGDNFLDGLLDRRVDDPCIWQLAHELLLEEVASAVAERPYESFDRAANRAAWAKFLAATRRIELAPEGTRVALSHRTELDAFSGRPRSRRILEVTHDLAVRSELRTPVQGELRLGSLPPGARPTHDVVPIGPIAEMELTRKPLAWSLGGPLPCDLDGHYLQRIRFDAAASGETQVDAVLSIVQAPPMSGPIAVDGDLSDWLPNEYNAAGDFRLITRAAPSSTSSRSPSSSLVSAADRPRALSQTVAYFCRDAATLYVAIQAASPPGGSEDAQNNRITSDIEYEDLAPVGEDLVEILIDPTNRGSLADDLFHIVIKSNGIGVFEKGIGMTPAIARRTPWPGPRPRHVVVRTDSGWSAELAIPLAALGVPGKSTVWGLNIARSEPMRGEYSDWARVPRYCYDPRTLGNLLWPE